MKSTEEIFEYGRRLQKQGFFELAMKEFDEAASRDPNIIECQHAKAECLMTLGRYPEALQLFDNVNRIVVEIAFDRYLTW